MKHVLFFLMFFITIHAFAQTGASGSERMPCCEKNVLKNGELIGNCPQISNYNMDNACVPGWNVGTYSPQHVPIGHNTQGAICMWGNQKVGESVYQQVNIVSGRRYRISCSIKTSDVKNLGIYFKFRAATSAPGYTSTTVMGITPTVNTGDGWIRVTLPDWTATGNFSYINVAPENQYNVDEGEKTTYGCIDDICIEELPPCEQLHAYINGPTNICEGSAATYSVPTFPGVSYAWTVSPAVAFNGNGTNQITIPGTSTMGKTTLTITVKILCGGKEIIRTLLITIRKNITNADFSLTTVQGSPNYSCNATPIVSSGYNHQWLLYSSPTPFTNCNLPGPAGAIMVAFQTTVNFSYANLKPGGYYLLRHYVQNCNGQWLMKTKCWQVVNPNARLAVGAAVPITIKDAQQTSLSEDQVQSELINAEIASGGKGGN